MVRLGSRFQTRSLKLQLLFSHLFLVLLMVVVMIGAIISFFSLGRSVDRIFRNNYKSVVAAQQMKDSLERLDSSAAFVLAGQKQIARAQYQENRKKFEKAYFVEAHNITEPGEGQIADNIGRLFPVYKKNLEKLLYADPPLPINQSRGLYFSTLEPGFLQIKQLAQDVLDINQAAIIRADRRARAEARSASWRSIVITIAAFLFALFFALRMVRAIRNPILTLAEQSEEIGAGHLDQHIDIARSDEIGILASSFNRMSEKLREARKVQEKQLHFAQRMSDEALTSLYDPVIVTGAEGRIIHVNHAAEGLFGSSDKLVGAMVEDVIKEDEIVREIKEAIKRRARKRPEEEPDRVKIEVGAATRTYYPRATVMKDDDGTLLGAVAVLEDVTHLTELDRMKTEFISVASHELRTPVSSLLLAAQLLKEGAAGELTTKQQEIVAAQLQDLDRIDKLMIDLLDLTRLELGTTTPHMEIILPNELVQAAIDSVASQAEVKGINLISDLPEGLTGVRADRSQIVRVLINLLNNAIRHTPPGGSVTASVSAHEGKMSFSVKDTGTGIPKDYLSRIFDRFVQVPGATMGGAGLGLSIAQAIVKAHDGEIVAESELGQGSTFTFTLPLK